MEASLLFDSLAISASVRWVIASGFSRRACANAFSALGRDGIRNLILTSLPQARGIKTADELALYGHGDLAALFRDHDHHGIAFLCHAQGGAVPRAERLSLGLGQGQDAGRGRDASLADEHGTVMQGRPTGCYVSINLK